MTCADPFCDLARRYKARMEKINNLSETPKAVVFDASFPDLGQPYKVHANGGGVVLFQWPETSYPLITALYGSGKGKRLRIMVEIED